MSASMSPFVFENCQLRVERDANDNPLFVAKDVAEALGYPRFDSNLIKHIPDEWKGTNPVRTPGGIQQMAVLTEQGLYFFVNRSDKPKAIPFQKWVAGEVIPSIQKTGSYSAPGAPQSSSRLSVEQEAAGILETRLKVAQLLQVPTHLAQSESVKTVRQLTGVDYQPLLQHSSAQDNIDDLSVMLEPTDIAERLGITYRRGSPDGSAVNKLLDKHGYQDKIDDNWEPTEKGAPYAARHQWTKGSKSGYNYKWRLDLVKELLEYENKQ